MISLLFLLQGQGRETPFALYTVAAYLIHFHIIQMLDLLGFVSSIERTFS